MRIELKEAGLPAKDEILKMAQGQKRVIIGGTDPLKRVDIVDVVRKLENQEIILETDGEAFAPMAEKLKKAGLTGVAIKVNTMRHTRYKKTHPDGDLNLVVEGINKAVDCGMKVRILAALEKGFSDDEVLDFVQLTFQHDYEIIFLPTMPYAEIKEKLRLHPVEGDFGEVEMFKYAVARGKIGFLKE